MNYIKTLKKRLQPERAERIAFMEWTNLYPNIRRFILAIPQEGKRNIITAVNLKRMGMRRGIPDYLFMHKSNKYSGLWIEFKAGKNKLTKDQKIFFEDAMSPEANYKCVVVYSAKEAIDAIKEYLQA